MSAIRRIIKLELKDADDNPFNPVSAFTRFGCWPLGPRSYLAVIRGIFATSIGLTIFIDYGLIDSLAHFKRGSSDGDSVWFWFRPPDWVHLSAFIMLVLMIIASGLKRVDSEMDTRHPKTYLAIWNLLIAVVPLSAASLIMYYQVTRWGASADDAYEATIIQVFVISCLELMWGAWPTELMNVALPTILAAGFVAYTALLSKVFKTDLYSQLDWEKNPQVAAVNAAIFILVVIACAMVSTVLALFRNRTYNKLNDTPYSKVETQSLFR